MTTLVYAGGTLASDSRTSIGHYVQGGHVAKIHLSKTRAGVAYGFTGDLQRAMQMIAWLDGADGHRPDLEEIARVVELRADGTVTVHEGEHQYDLVIGQDPIFAWGTGAAAALGALWAGAKAARAVECACKVDPQSGGPVQSVTLETLREHAETFKRKKRGKR